jgi:hypothetical protein
VYENDPAAAGRAEELARQYMAGIEKLQADQLALKKDEIRYLRDVCKYLAKFGIIPETYEARLELEQIIKAQNWDKKPK